MGTRSVTLGLLIVKLAWLRRMMSPRFLIPIIFGGGGVNPLLFLICSVCCSLKVMRGVAYMLASLQTVRAWGFPFIDMAVGGFGVNSVISFVLVRCLASFLSSLPWMG